MLNFSFTLPIVMEKAKVIKLPDKENKDVKQPGKYILVLQALSSKYSCECLILKYCVQVFLTFLL